MEVLERRIALGLSSEAKSGLDDLLFFCNWFGGLSLEEKPHREMCDLIQHAEVDPTRPYVMLVVPRGCYKSSIANMAVTWKILRQIYLHDNVYHRIVIASATLALGKAAVSSIEGVWRYGGLNERINTHFSSLWANKTLDRPSSKKEDGLVCAQRIRRGETAEVKEPTVFIGSMRRISTGFHADEAVIDDLNNKENVRTDFQIKQTHTYYQLLYPIIGTKDRAGNPTKMTMLCTPWHDYDVRGMILKEEAERAAEEPDYQSKWRILHRGSYLDDGSAFFPSKYPLSRLEELRRAMGAREFAANYLCDPVGDNGFVAEEEIKWKDRDTFPPLQWGRITVDPNQHKEAKEVGCYAAITVVAYDKFGRMYVLDARGSREWGTERFIDELFKLSEQYPGWPIFMEDAYMGHFDAALRMEEGRRSNDAGHLVRLRVNYMPIDVQTTKYERWQKLQPRFKNGTIYFSDSIAPSIKVELKEELVRGQAARFKDFLDALAMAETGFRPKVHKDGSFQEIKESPRPKVPGEFTWADMFGSRLRGVM